MLCHSHLKEAILALQEDCDNQRPRRIMLTTTIKRVAKRCGSSIFQCPISGQPYQINPDEQMWSNALKNQDARTVALYCPCRQHHAVLGVSFYGVLQDLDKPPQWVRGRDKDSGIESRGQ
jgi:hypothetical protein